MARKKATWEPKLGVHRISNEQVDTDTEDTLIQRSFPVWTHDAPHIINKGEVDGEVSFSEEVKNRARLNRD